MARRLRASGFARRLRAGAPGFGRNFAIGALASLGQAPFGLWPLALAGFALALLRIGAATGPGAAFARGVGVGAGYFGISLSWIVQPFFVDPLRHGWMAPFAVLGVAFGLGLFWGAAGWLSRRMGGGAVTLALALSLAELARGHVLTGFPWALPGHIWAGTWLAQMAALTGAYGMTLLTLLAVAAPLSLGPWRGGALTLAIAGLAGGWSLHRLSLPEPPARPGLVRIVQPDIEQSLKWDPDLARANFDLLRALSTGDPVDLVIWPETAVPYLVEPEGPVAQAISASAGGAPVATGIQRDEGAGVGEGSGRAWNTLAVFGPGGRVGQHFDKVHLVPFGEYIPGGDLVYRLTGLRAFASQVGAGYTAGEGRNLLDFGELGRALPLICYEAIFPQHLAGTARGDWILQVTNDAWFGTLTGPYQHFAQVRLRAIEQGLPVLRAANTGISAVIDARGRVARLPGGAAARLDLGMRGVIEAAIPGALPAPPYARMIARFGEAPLLALLLAGLGLSALRGRRIAAG
ncbi:apolipoprotein N-acyltransferase [Pseudogemmobacter sonorensis]|uniref:apolipoprotein N-acyltransferase n=1 Tax=Pseudogemmobacter sonorensis TaxID=2989681 RepID=UPI0036ADFEB9